MRNRKNKLTNFRKKIGDFRFRIKIFFRATDSGVAVCSAVLVIAGRLTAKCSNKHSPFLMELSTKVNGTMKYEKDTDSRYDQMDRDMRET